MYASEYYQMYLAMRLHFSTATYNYNKYNGKVSNLPKRWAKCKIKSQMASYKRQWNSGQFFNYLLAAMLYSNGTYIVGSPAKNKDDIVDYYRLAMDMDTWKGNPGVYFQKDLDYLLKRYKINSSSVKLAIEYFLEKMLGHEVIEEVYHHHTVNINTLFFIYLMVPKAFSKFVDQDIVRTMENYKLLTDYRFFDDRLQLFKTALIGSFAMVVLS